jgi:hypothetical protein
MALTANARAIINSVLTGTTGTADNISTIAEQESVNLTSDTVYTGTVSATTTPASIDLADDTATFDALGNGIEFDTIQTLYIKNNGDGAITVGGVNNPALVASNEVINIASGACLLYTNNTGLTVPASGVLTITSASTSSVDVIIIGTAPSA